MRNRYNEQLNALGEALIRMGSRCVEAITSVIGALTRNDASLAVAAIEAEHDIDEMESEIESMCLRLLIQQQPVARDLRYIAAASKMISDMERIGDQASDIAELTRRNMGRANECEAYVAEMAAQAVEMVTDAVRAFVAHDEKTARAVIARDDIVDGFFDRIRSELVERLKTDSAESDYYLDLLMITKYLERIGDHAVNVAEWVIYTITGIHESSEHHY